MKILYLADARDIHTQRLARYFANQNDRVHIASFREYENLENLENVHIHLMKKSPVFSEDIMKGPLSNLLKNLNLGSTFVDPLFALVQLKDLTDEINPDVMHCQSIVAHTVIGAMSGFHPFVLSPMGSDIQVYPKVSPLVRMVVKAILRSADAITAESESLKEMMIELGADESRIRTVNRGVDRRQFGQPQRDEELRRTLGVDSSMTIISTRRMAPVHDVQTLIMAIPLILREVPNLSVIIVGDGPEKRTLLELSKSLGISKNVRFVGMLAHEDIPRYLASSDIYVSTSLSDGCSVSTLEALACQIAPVVTDVGNHRQFIKDGENGFIIPPGNHEILAQRLIVLLKNDTIRARFSHADHGIWEFADYEKEMTKMRASYNNAIARVGKKRSSDEWEIREHSS